MQKVEWVANRWDQRLAGINLKSARLEVDSKIDVGQGSANKSEHLFTFFFSFSFSQFFFSFSRRLVLKRDLQTQVSTISNKKISLSINGKMEDWNIKYLKTKSNMKKFDEEICFRRGSLFHKIWQIEQVFRSNMRPM